MMLAIDELDDAAWLSSGSRGEKGAERAVGSEMAIVGRKGGGDMLELLFLGGSPSNVGFAYPCDVGAKVEEGL